MLQLAKQEATWVYNCSNPHRYAKGNNPVSARTNYNINPFTTDPFKALQFAILV